MTRTPLFALALSALAGAALACPDGGHKMPSASGHAGHAQHAGHGHAGQMSHGRHGQMSSADHAGHGQHAAGDGKADAGDAKPPAAHEGHAAGHAGHGSPAHTSGTGAADHAAGGHAGGDHAAHATKLASARARGLEIEPIPGLALPGAALIAEDGAATDLQALVGDRIVLVDFIFTTCTTICPVSSVTLADVRSRLGARMGEDILHLSISTDPMTDSPARLRAYAEPFAPHQGWRLLTGEKPTVDGVLRAFDAYTADFRDHPLVTVVGDVRTGEFYRLFGVPDPEQVVDLVEHLAAARGNAT